MSPHRDISRSSSPAPPLVVPRASVAASTSVGSHVSRPPSPPLGPPHHEEAWSSRSPGTSPQRRLGFTPLPYLLPPPSRPPNFVDSSVIHELDGILFAFFGIRVEHDVMAPRPDFSFTQAFGFLPSQSLSTVIGLYLTDFEVMPAVVQAAADHRAAGVFIVPVRPGAAPLIYQNGSSIGPWYNLLLRHSRFIVRLPCCAFHLHGRSPSSNTFGVVAVLADFGKNLFISKHRRPENTITIPPPSIGTGGGPPPIFVPLGPVPFLTTRIGEEADRFCPSAAMDNAPPLSTPLPVSKDHLPPMPESPFNSEEFETSTASFPDAGTRSLALQAMRSQLRPFHGDRMKAVAAPVHLRPHSEEEALAIRATLLKGVSKGFRAGPYQGIPQPLDHRRVRCTPAGVVKKDKYKPESDRLRLISMFNAHEREGGGSINELCYSPKFLAFHFSGHHVAALAEHYGRRCRFTWLDVPNAFKCLVNTEDMLELFVTELLTTAYGREFYVELCYAFGWTPAEWAWQAVLAMILWRLHHEFGFPEARACVDNFCFVHPPGVDAESREDDILSAFRVMCVPIHELQSCKSESGGSSFTALGWEWDTMSQEMICPLDKYGFYLQQFSTWSTAPTVSVHDVESMIGMMQWLTQGFTVGRPDLYLFHPLRTKMQAEASRLRRRGVIRKTLSQQQRAVLCFWRDQLIKWDRRCPIVCEIGPTFPAQYVGRVDASTSWGCGGIFWDPLTGSLLGFQHKWPAGVIAQGLSSGVLETAGILLWLQVFGETCARSRVRLSTDSECAMLAFRASLYSSSSPLMRADLLSSRIIIHFVSPSS